MPCRGTAPPARSPAACGARMSRGRRWSRSAAAAHSTFRARSRPCGTSARRRILHAALAERRGEPLGALRAILANTPPDARDRETAVAARADRSTGDQGRRRHLRDLDARARDRGAGARQPGCGRGDPRPRSRASSATTSQKLKPGSAEAMAPEGGADRAGRVEPVSRSRHRSRCGDLHQDRADGGGRHTAWMRGCIRNRAGTTRSRKSCSSSPRPAGSSGRRSATTSTCATSRAARRCSCRKAKDNNASCGDRPLHALLRRDVLARRRAPDDGDAHGRRHGRVPPRGLVLDRQDQPRSGGPRRRR